MIHVEHLTKRYGKYLAVNDISIDVAPGEIFGFLLDSQRFLRERLFHLAGGFTSQHFPNEESTRQAAD